MNTKHKLEEYINLVDIRNKNLTVKKLLGVSINKTFIKSIANTIGTDFSNYKIVRRRQFAYCPVTSRNGEKISIALLQEDDCIISSSYTVFEITDTEKLLPEYLMLWFMRPEFDRYARFKSHGSVREIFDWEQLCNVELPVPTIERQKEIVKVYCTITDRITLKNCINENLEQQAQAIFDDMFIDVTNGTHTVSEYVTLKRGKALLSKNAVSGDVPVIAGGLEPTTYHNTSNTTAPVLTVSASGANAGFVNLWHIPVWSSDSSFIDSTMTRNVYFWYVMLKKRQKEIFDKQTGSAQPHIYPQHIAILPVIKLNNKDISKFTDIVMPLFDKIGKNKQENQNLSALRDILIPKLINEETDVSEIKI